MPSFFLYEADADGVAISFRALMQSNIASCFTVLEPDFEHCFPHHHLPSGNVSFWSSLSWCEAVEYFVFAIPSGFVAVRVGVVGG